MRESALCSCFFAFCEEDGICEGDGF